MENTNTNFSQNKIAPSIHWGHFGVILAAMVLILGMSWMEKPDLFKFHKQAAPVAGQNAPHYYAYVTPPEDQPQPAVLGASTDQGPDVIGDDGTVAPVDMGQVLGASTQGVQLSLDSVVVKQIADSSSAIKQYFTQAQAIELNPVDTAAFKTALSSNDQTQINQQAQKLTGVRDALQKLSVPQSLVKLQQLKIIQYTAAVNLLQNFSQADSNPTLVDQTLLEFIKSQQDLNTENVSIAQKFGALDPSSALYIDESGQPIQPAPTVNDSLTADGAQNPLNNSDNSDASQ